MLTRLLASLLGLAFLAVAALGLMPNEITGPGRAIDFSMAHSVIHFIFGVFLLFGVWLAANPRFVLRSLGLLYVVVAVIGADRIGDQLVQLYNGVEATRWLELALALTLVVLGFMAGGLAVRRPVKAAAPVPVESEAQQESVEDAWVKAETGEKAAEPEPAAAAEAAREAGAEAAEQEEPKAERVADSIERALSETETEETETEDAKPGQDIGRGMAETEDEKPVRETEKESRGFGLFGPKPQPQS